MSNYEIFKEKTFYHSKTHGRGVYVRPSAKKFIYTYSIYNQLKLVLRRPAVWLSIFPICNLYWNFQDFF